MKTNNKKDFKIEQVFPAPMAQGIFRKIGINLKLFLFSILTIIAFQNCTNESYEYEIVNDQAQDINEPTTENIDKRVYDYIQSIGLNPEKIEEYESFYLVEGDLMFTKSDIDNAIVEIKKGVADRHAHTNNLVSSSNVTSMTVYVDSSIPSSGADNWRNAVSSAIQSYNSVNGTDVNFIYTTNNNADIIIYSDNGALGNNVIASANFPSNGQPHHTILVNLDYSNNKNVSELSKKYNMAHELGHCIGFRHTNWDTRGEGTGSVGANIIPGTPSQDPNSIMNGGTAEYSWTGFSSYDIVALKYLYPAPAPQQNTFDGPTYITSTSPLAQGTLTIVNSTTLKLTAFGGASTPSSTYITLSVSGIGNFNLYANKMEHKSLTTSTIPPGTYTYQLSGSFTGSSGNSGKISFY